MKKKLYRILSGRNFIGDLIYFLRSAWRLSWALLLLSMLFLGSCIDSKKEKLIAEIIEVQEKNRVIRYDTSLRELKKLDKKIQKSKYIPDPLKAENDYLLGLCYEKKGDLEKAGIYLNRATTYAKDFITNKEEPYFYHAWFFYFKQELWGDCITISNRFKFLLDEERDFELLAMYYFFVENVHKKIKRYDDALEANRFRIEMLKKSEDPYHNIPKALISKAASKYDQGKKQEAIYILDSLILQQDSLTADHKRHLFGNYGTYQFEAKEYEEALKSYLLALSFKDRKSKSKLATSYCNIAECYLYLKEYDTSKIYLDSVKLLGIKNISTEVQKRYYKYQVLLASAPNKNYNKLSKPIDEVFGLLDEEYNKKYEKDLDALQLAHQRERKLIKNQQYVDEKLSNFKSKFLFIVLILAGVILFILYQHEIKKYEEESLQMQQRLLLAQMNKHFTFNFLYSIQNQIKENPSNAVDYLLKFSRLLRLTLENSMHNYVQLEKELESLRRYMDLQLLRFPGKFSYDIILEDLEEDDMIFIPPMLLQPMIENCIDHGFANIDYEGEIKITLFSKDKFLQCSIEDNGSGIKQTRNLEKQSSSMRLITKFLKRTTKQTIKIKDKKRYVDQQSGVLISFLIPVRLLEQ